MNRCIASSLAAACFATSAAHAAVVTVSYGGFGIQQPYGQATRPLNTQIVGNINSGSGNNRITGSFRTQNSIQNGTQVLSVSLQNVMIFSDAAGPVTATINVVEDFVVANNAELLARASHQFAGQTQFVSADQSAVVTKTSTHESTVLPTLDTGLLSGIGTNNFTVSQGQFVTVGTNLIYRMNVTYTVVITAASAGVAQVVLGNPATDTATLALLPTLLCDSIDFNGDGLFPDDADLVDFLSVLAGGPCSTGTCNDIDFNNDGLFPDDNDLLAFLRVFAGGSCS